MIRSVFFFLSMLVLAANSYGQQLRIATYNLRFDNPRDSGNLWVDRAPVVSELIRFHDFDIFGTQEALKNQLDDVSKALPYYSRFGHGRDDGKEKGEHSAIYYKTERFDLLDSGDFWLSQTPEKPSLGWDATCCNRICSWVKLREKKSKKVFYVFNAHFDHQGMQARRESGKLILEKISAIAGRQPVVFTGDLNGDHDSEWYKVLAQSDMLEDSYTLVSHPYASNASFNAFGKARKSRQIIDHIFITNHFTVKKWGVLTDTYYGKFPSDHFPVVADITFK